MASYEHRLSQTHTREQVQVMDFPLWKQLLTETIYWQKIDDSYAFNLYQRIAITWGMGDQYFIQGPERVDLTKLFEDYKLLAILKGTYHGSEINSEDC